MPCTGDPSELFGPGGDLATPVGRCGSNGDEPTALVVRTARSFRAPRVRIGLDRIGSRCEAGSAGQVPALEEGSSRRCQGPTTQEGQASMRSFVGGVGRRHFGKESKRTLGVRDDGAQTPVPPSRVASTSSHRFPNSVPPSEAAEVMQEFSKVPFAEPTWLGPSSFWAWEQVHRY